jgi:hypothetical protein
VRRRKIKSKKRKMEKKNPRKITYKMADMRLVTKRKWDAVQEDVGDSRNAKSRFKGTKDNAELYKFFYAICNENDVDLVLYQLESKQSRLLWDAITNHTPIEPVLRHALSQLVPQKIRRQEKLGFMFAVSPPHRERRGRLFVKNDQAHNLRIPSKWRRSGAKDGVNFQVLGTTMRHHRTSAIRHRPAKRPAHQQPTALLSPAFTFRFPMKRDFGFTLEAGPSQSKITPHSPDELLEVDQEKFRYDLRIAFRDAVIMMYLLAFTLGAFGLYLLL